MHQKLIVVPAFFAALAQSSGRNDYECDTTEIEFLNLSTFEGPSLLNMDQIGADL